MQGSGFRVQTAGFRVQISGFRVQGAACAPRFASALLANGVFDRAEAVIERAVRAAPEVQKLALVFQRCPHPVVPERFYRKIVLI